MGDIERKTRFYNRFRGIFAFPRHRYLFFILLLIVAVAQRGSPSNNVQSYILDVPYHDQQTSYYCGPASIKMVMEYANGIELSQDVLSSELSTDIQNITHTGLMDEPFIHRDLTDVKDGRMTLNQLKKQLTLGYAPILLIWFDENHETGHYVVAVGYNQTGIFINDPWPTSWGKPDGRETGPYVYLSNEKLLDLWAICRNWAITVAYTASEKLVKVDVAVIGLPDGLKTPLCLNGETLDILDPDKTISLILSDEPHILSVDTVLYDKDGTVFYCTNNLQQVPTSENTQFVYTLLYQR